ncbi:MAG: hypothetical protein WAK91_10575, partial [Candidatus Acidiferrales bacterium]
MSQSKKSKSKAQLSQNISEETERKSTTRRAFLGQITSAAAVTVAAAAAASAPLSASAAGVPQQSPRAQVSASTVGRALTSFNNRVSAAQTEFQVATPVEITNGDETRYPNLIGNYSKGLAHNSIGEVESASYASLLKAIQTGNPQQFEQIQLGGTALLVDPQSGLAFDLEGTDSHKFAIGTPPPVASQAIADAAIESYWMALCRDVNCTQYG